MISFQIWLIVIVENTLRFDNFLFFNIIFIKQIMFFWRLKNMIFLFLFLLNIFSLNIFEWGINIRVIKHRNQKRPFSVWPDSQKSVTQKSQSPLKNYWESAAPQCFFIKLILYKCTNFAWKLLWLGTFSNDLFEVVKRSKKIYFHSWICRHKR